MKPAVFGAFALASFVAILEGLSGCAASAPVVPVSAGLQFTSADADSMMNAFNTSYYVSVSPGVAHYSTQYATVSTKTDDHWHEAELIELGEDAALRNPAYMGNVSALLNGYIASYGTLWTSDPQNDDLMWAVIAFARGYMMTGNASYLNAAKANFDATWARAYDPTTGGLWWNTADTSQINAVEGPATVAAYLLGTALKDPSYRQKSLGLLQFILANYYDPSSGAVYSYQIGSVTPNPIVTHQLGLFIKSAGSNGYDAQAQQALSYMKMMGATTTTSNGYNILPNYGTNTVVSFNNAVGLRWASSYVLSHNLSTQYLGWLQANAASAWAVRDTTQNLSWPNWSMQTPSGYTLLSWDSIAAADALQVVPPTQ